MALLSLLTRDVDVERAVRRPLEDRHVVVRVGSWERLLLVVRERPVTGVLVDGEFLPRSLRPPGAVAELSVRFPGVPLIWLARPAPDPIELLQLGRAGVDRLLLIPLDDVEREVAGSVARALGRGTEALVTREVSPYLPPRTLAVVRLAVESVHRRPGAEEVARQVGLTRPHLSVLLKERGLPSLGHLLVWGRMLHAGRWLPEPGRTAESVSRQLDYSSGAAFRRALKNYLGATPTQVVEQGGLEFVMSRFMDRCGWRRWGRDDRSAA